MAASRSPRASAQIASSKRRQSAIASFGSFSADPSPSSGAAAGVAERAQALRDLRSDGGWRGRPVPSAECGQRPAQAGGVGGAGRGQVARFRGIRVQVVQLRPRRLDVLERALAHRVQRRPAQRARVERLRVDAAIGVPRPEIRPVQARGNGDAEEREQRRRDVHRPRGAAPPLAAGHARARQDQRDPQRGLIDEEAVGQLAVLAQGLAVIGHHQDHEPAAPLRGGHQAAHAGVGVGHLAVVGLSVVAARGTAAEDRRARAGRRGATQARKGAGWRPDPGRRPRPRPRRSAARTRGRSRPRRAAR